ncbi:MAG TPA: hypothetical protein VF939_21020 [Puia sp.]
MTDAFLEEFDDTNYKKPPNDEPLTLDTWYGFWITEYDLSIDSLTGHRIADNRMARKLEKVIATSQNFDELKSQLLTIIQNIKEVEDDINDKWCGPDAKKWGFPPLD